MRALNVALLKDKLEIRAKENLADARIGGAALLVAQHGREFYRGYFGTVSPESDVPVSQSTLYRLASMTKPITAVMALIAVERRLLSLEDPIAKYLPAFRKMTVIDPKEDGSYGEISTDVPLTVWHLLTHTSGLRSSRAAAAFAGVVSEQMSLSEYADCLASRPLAFVPGTAQEYNATAAFDMLALILEKVTDTDYNELLHRELFVPLGMADTTFLPTDDQWGRLIAMHDRIDGKSVVREKPRGCVFENYPVTHYLGGAGLISSLDDYAHFAEMLRAGGAFHGVRILTEASVRNLSRLHVDHEIVPGCAQHWGLGVRVVTGESYGRLPVGAYGWSGAYGSHFWVDPVNDIVGIYMKNSAFDGGSGAQTSNDFEADVHASLQD